MGTQAYGFDPKFDWSKLDRNYDGTQTDPFETGGDINKLATSQNSTGLPGWLTRNPNDLTRELRQTYKHIPGMFDDVGIGAAYDDAIANVRGMGGQIATNAAAEAIARAGQTGGQVNSEMAKAQAMLPVYSETAGLAKEKANTLLDAAKAKASLHAEVASTLGQLRTSYLGNLAQVYMQKKGLRSGERTNAAELALRKYQGDQANTLQMEELAQRGSQFDRQHNLAEMELGFQQAAKRSGAYMTDNSGKFTSGDRGLYDINTSINPRIASLLG